MLLYKDKPAFKLQMSSYIIAGSADSIDTAYCEEIARRIKSKYKNIDFRVVIKHASEWEDYLQEICRIYGFLKKSNPIIYTFDGKIIGNRENFVQNATKYFGLDEELLIVENLTSKINMKLAQEEVRQKKIVKNNIKTLEEKIDSKYKDLLAKKICKYALKEKEEYLVNGIEYIHRELENMCQTVKFTKVKNIPIVNEEIVPEDINLMALSLHDQIKPEQTLVKQAFVTANQKEKHPPSEQDRMSQASKTNKMHESIVSYDKDSKGVKESNRTKLRIDEQNDDVPDYVDYPIKQTIVCELSDQFFVAFEPKSLIGQQLIFYHNEDHPNGNTLRVHNDGRPIKGHRVLIKEVHYQNQILIEENVSKNQIFDGAEGEEGNLGEQAAIEKSKTQPNIPMIESEKNLHQPSKNVQEDAISEPHSDLNLISHLNYHTLFIHKPLSVLELKNLHYFVKETNTIGCLQFLPENPNPRVRLYVRKYLLRDESALHLLPIEKFIEKQLEQKEYIELIVPSDKGTILLLEQQITQSYKITQINDIGFNHFIYQYTALDNEQKLNKIIKYVIDHMLSIEEEIKRDIGYNLIFTKKYLMIVPLVEPYEIYDGMKLYFDGLAYLGYVHTARVEKAYQIKIPKIGNENKGEELRRLLAVASGKNDD